MNWVFSQIAAALFGRRDERVLCNVVEQRGTKRLSYDLVKRGNALYRVNLRKESGAK